MIARPDPATFQVMPLAIDRANDGSPGGDSARMFCDIQNARRFAVVGRSPLCTAPRTEPRPPRCGFTFYTHPEIEFFLLSRTARRMAASPDPIDNGGYFDMTSHDSAHNFRRDRRSPRWKSLGISVEFSHHEVAPGPAGDRPALRRCVVHGRQHHDVSSHRSKRSRDQPRRRGDVHAQAVPPPAGQRHAHASVAVRGRPQRLPRSDPTRSTCPRTARNRSSQGVLRHAPRDRRLSPISG